MTYVLAYLAARSLRGAHAVPTDDGASMPVIRPRLPSRYEVNGRQPQIAVEEIEQESASVEPAPAPAGRPTVPAVTADTSTEPPPPWIEPVVAPRPPIAVPKRSAQRITAPDKARPARTAQSVVPPPEPNRAVDAVLPAAHAAPPAQPSASHAAVTSARDPDQFRARSPRVAPRPVAEQSTHDSISPPPARLVSAPKPLAPLAPVAAVARIAPRESLQLTAAPNGARPRDAADLSRTPPRVQVTIGRLEIRATVVEPPTPPRRAAPRPPALSLDDYLAGRSKT